MSQVGLAVLAVVVLATAAVWFVVDRRADAREQEWKHGGDQVVVRAGITGATSSEDYRAARSRSGVPASAARPSAPQVFVVDVEWEAAPAGGDLSFILLDARVGPPEPVRAVGSWSDERDEDSLWIGWNGSWEEPLVSHYPWLARTASQHEGGSWVNDTSVLGAGSGTSGSATLEFWLTRRGMPSDRPHRDFVLAVIHSDEDGEVRWARRVELQRP